MSSKSGPPAGSGPKKLGPRSLGRDLALRYLYACDLMGEEVESLDAFTKHQEVKGPAVEFGRRLVEGTLAFKDGLDALLASFAQNWRLERMAVVDRNVLRLGSYELAREPEIPAGVTLDEMVELAKRYGTNQSGSFVNGILERVRRYCEEAEGEAVLPEPEKKPRRTVAPPREEGPSPLRRAAARQTGAEPARGPHDGDGRMGHEGDRPYRDGPRRDDGPRGPRPDRPYRDGPRRDDGPRGPRPDRPYREGPRRDEGPRGPRPERPYRDGPRRDEGPRGPRPERPYRDGPRRDEGPRGPRPERPYRDGPRRDEGPRGPRPERPYRDGPRRDEGPRGPRPERPYRDGPRRDEGPRGPRPERPYRDGPQREEGPRGPRPERDDARHDEARPETPWGDQNPWLMGREGRDDARSQRDEPAPPSTPRDEPLDRSEEPASSDRPKRPEDSGSDE